MRKTIVLHGLVVVGLALAAKTATADDSRGFYAGVGVGAALVDDDASNFDDDDTGFKLFAGYSFGKFLDIELAYIDAGTAKGTDSSLFFFSPGGGLDSAALGTEIDTRAVNLSAIGKLPLTENLSLFGKLGYASIDQEIEVRLLTDAFGLNNTIFASDDRKEEISYGLGLNYDIGKKFQLRAEYEGFDVRNGSLEFISLNGVFRFR